jgi:hypothetical protein
MASFVWGDGGTQLTPEAIAAQRKVAQAMMQRGGDYSPVQSAWQGVARVAEGLMGGLDARAADAAERRNMAAEQALLASLIPGAAAPAAVAPAAATAVAPVAAPPAAGDAAAAIAAIESGGKYDRLGPVIKSGDRAYGKYQVMGSNIPQWTATHTGTALTPDQFLASPEAQEAVFKGQFGQYAQKYGPEGAAKAWFAGERGMNNPNARDILGTTVQAYADKFRKNYQPAVAAIEQASPLDTAQWPAGPVGAPSAEAALPPNAQPAQGYAIPGQPAAPQSGVNPRLVAAMSSPYVSEGTKKILGIMLTQQMKPQEYTYQTTPDGTILRMDPRGTAPQPVYTAPTKATYGVIGKDAFGNEQYGWIDPVRRTTTSSDATGGGAPAPAAQPTVTGPDGTQIPIPPGVNPKKFRDDVTSAVADAATGKKTEVQGSAEQFANRLELAERNFQGLEGEVKGASGVAQTVAGRVPVVGSFAQTPNFQKMEQAKSQFITALLRKESGAAIGREEFNRYDKEFFPQPGDAPEVVTQKAQARQVAIEAMKKTAGPGYKPPATTTAPAVTKTINGKTYYQENGQWYEK